jgi:CubicO group peptidase (beta-lactamase class C family)
MRRTRAVRLDDSEIKEEFREEKKKVDEIMRERLPPDGPGVAVLVMVNDIPVLKEGYGKARIGAPTRAITPDTIFDLASLSKQFTALAILMLIDRTTRGRRPDGGDYKELYFNTSLRSILPKLPAWADEITVRNLLNHSSAVPEYDFLRKGDSDRLDRYYERVTKATGDWYASMKGYEKVNNKRRYLTNEGVLKLLAGQNRAEAPGQSFAYSNTGYVLLAEIIKERTGKSLRRFLKDEIFDYLGMNKTFVYDETVSEFRKHALCYRLPSGRGNANYRSIDCDTEFNYIHGDGNIHSSINDLVKWVKAWNEIDDNKRNGLINTSTFLKIYKPGLTGRMGEYWAGRERYKYASGMQIYRYKNRTVNSYAIHHGGNWLGFNSYLMRGHVALYRHEEVYEVTVLVLSNYLSDWREPNSPFKIGKRIAEIYWPLQNMPRYNVLRYI